jgi:hypothetical protein
LGEANPKGQKFFGPLDREFGHGKLRAKKAADEVGSTNALGRPALRSVTSGNLLSERPRDAYRWP